MREPHAYQNINFKYVKRKFLKDILTENNGRFFKFSWQYSVRYFIK